MNQKIIYALGFFDGVHLGHQALLTACRELAKQEGMAVIAMPGLMSPSYAQVGMLAEEIAAAVGDRQVMVCLEQDMAKALGQALALRLGRDVGILCLDRVKIGEGSYLDVGAPVGPAMPVVVKTLVLGK